jgi:hypothetical protein
MGGNLCRLLNGKRSNIQNIQRGLEFNPQIALKKKKRKEYIDRPEILLKPWRKCNCSTSA